MAGAMHGRYFGASMAAVVITGLLALLSTCGSLYLYISYKINGYFPGNGTVTTGDLPLYTPASSVESYQEVFLLCAAVASVAWVGTAVTLAVGVIQTRDKLYIPWLVWSVIMVSLCLFGIFHNLSFLSTIYQYVLGEYVVMAVITTVTIPFSCVVYADYSSRNVKSSGKV